MTPGTLALTWSPSQDDGGVISYDVHRAAAGATDPSISTRFATV